jgi:hypothetical protein
MIMICMKWGVAMPDISHRIHVSFFGERLINSLKKFVRLIRKEIDKATRKCYRKSYFEVSMEPN